jgi:hypothetical protein
MMVGRSVVALLFAMPLAGCATILGIGDLDAGPLGPSDAGGGFEAGDAPGFEAGGPDAACNPFDIGDAGGNVCLLPDGSSCAVSSSDSCGLTSGACLPAPVDTSKLSWVPPRPRMAACTSAELDAYVAACYGGTVAQCDAFRNAPGNATCAVCLTVSNPTAAAASVSFPIGESFLGTPNYGGCIALVDPCNEACAQDVFKWTQCQAVSCYDSCSADRDAGPTERAMCTDSAQYCPCYGYASAGGACFQALARAGMPAARCIPSATASLEQNARTVAEVFCTDE